MARLLLITGGQRSGKSAYAEARTRALDPRPVYVATARIWDDDFRRRVEAHRARRGDEWSCIEEEKYPARHDLRGRTALVDCATLWATNFFFDLDADADRAFEAWRGAFDALMEQEIRLVVVTNEIGLGGIAADPVQRRFADLQGRINQYLAARAEEAVLVVSGIPVRIK